MATNQSVLSGNVHVETLTATTMTLPASSVSNSNVAAAAGIAATKLQHQHQKSYAQESDVTAAADTRVLHVVRGATCTLVDFVAGLVSPNTGDATCTIDLKKNGSSVLTSTLSLTSSHTARQAVSATINTAGGVVGDVYEVDITVNAGTGSLGTGFFAQLNVREDAQ